MELRITNHIAEAVMEALDDESFLVFEPNASVTDVIDAFGIDEVVADLEERGFLVFAQEASKESIADALRDQDLLIYTDYPQAASDLVENGWIVLHEDGESPENTRAAIALLRSRGYTVTLPDYDSGSCDLNPNSV